MAENKIWCAIGDSFTYLDSHLDETGYRLKKGYLTRTMEKLRYPAELINIGINGSSTTDWLEQELVCADVYTVLLGTNDWFSAHTPLGTKEEYCAGRKGSILGNLRVLIEHIRILNKTAPIIVMNPVERGDFVYIADHTNHAHGSYAPENGLWLSEVAKAIYEVVSGDNIYTLDLHNKAGFTPENAVHFKRVRKAGKIVDLPYPEYTAVPYHPQEDPYPYPEEAVNMTYDGLHPSDKGCEKIAELLAERLNEIEI